jgi:hypothetical protein
MNPSARAESGIASTKTTIPIQKCIENRRVGIVRCRSCKRDATRHMTRRIFSILVPRSEVSRSRSRRYSSSRPRRLPEQIGSLDFCHKHAQAPGVSLCIENGNAEGWKFSATVKEAVADAKIEIPSEEAA